MAHDEQRTPHNRVNKLAVAMGFLTVLPVPTIAFYPGLLGSAARWFPMVGLIIGLLLSGSHWLLSAIFRPMLVAALTTALWAGLTGGLHLDGLADSFDGLMAPVPSKRRLEIMRDPRTGSFAVIGLILLLLLKNASIGTLAQAWPTLLLAPTWARWLLLWVAHQPTADSSRLGAEFSTYVTKQTLLFAICVPLVLTLFFLSWQLLLALGGGLVTTWFIIRSARIRLGGMTGDVYGLAVELSELVILLCMAIYR